LHALRGLLALLLR